MNLHEYQAKEVMRQHGIAVPDGKVADTPDSAWAVAKELGGDRWVVKAQVHAGGRGKAGGVKIVDNEADLKAAVEGMIGTRLVTFQTDANGQPVHKVLVEKPSDIADELYLSAVVDRVTKSVIIMASTEGGMEIEEVAEKTPEKIIRVVVDPVVGLQPFQCRHVFFKLGLDAGLMRDFTTLLLGFYSCFIESDLGMLEVNPLVVTGDNKLVCLDGKFNIDDNALFRHPALRDMRDPSQEDARENRAAEFDLNYVSLDGNIGCMVNGAGLAMATMDLIKLSGGDPANFLDVGGGATKERVAEAFKIILSDENVKGILVNIFGGIVRCDMIAEGIIAAVQDVDINVPVVVRLAGTNADMGAEKLAASGLNIVPATGFSEAANKIVELVNQQ